MIYSNNTYDITQDISTYTRRDFKSVFDTTSQKWYMLNNLNSYEEYGIYGDSLDGSKYIGKLVIVNNEEYEWDGTQWVDLGAVIGTEGNVSFREYFPDQASFLSKTINNVHWNMNIPSGSNYEDVYFSYSGPGATSNTPRFSMRYNNGVYTDTGFTDRNILQLPQDNDGYYYYNFSGDMYLSQPSGEFSNYLNYTTWDYAYTYINTETKPKYYTEKATPTIGSLNISTLYKNSTHMIKLYKNSSELPKLDYMSEDILKK